MKIKIVYLAIVTSIILRMGFVILRPNWQAPDEFPHFYYAYFLAKQGTQPEYYEEFPYYESYQPPLYYMFTAVIIKTIHFFNAKRYDSINSMMDKNTKIPEIFFVRLFSLLLSIGIILLGRKIFVRCFPNEPNLYNGVFILFLFHPTFISNTTGITNDALANLVGAIILLGIINCLITSKPLLLGFLLSLGMLTKANLLLFIPFALIIVILMKGDILKKVKICFQICLPIVIIYGGFWLFEYYKEGNFFLFPPFSVQSEQITLFRIYQVFRNFFWSIWAAFGRTYEIRLPAMLYVVIFLPVTLLAIIGLTKDIFSKYRFWQTDSIWCKFILITLLFFCASIYFSLHYSFFGTVNTSWGKNIFPVLPAVLALLAYGLNKILKKGVKEILLTLAGVCFFIDLWVLTKFIGMN